MSPSSIPIRWRITLFVTAVVGVFVFVGAFLGSRLWERQLRDSLDNFLVDELVELRIGGAATESEEEFMRFVDVWLVTESSHQAGSPFAIHLLDGRWLATDIPSSSYRLFPADLPTPGPGVITLSSMEFLDGKRYRLVAGSIGISGRQDLGIFYFSEPLAPLEADISQHNRDILLAAIGAVAVAGFGSYVVASRSLSPVRRLARTAESISQEDLSRRLDYPAPRDEVGELAIALNGMIERLDRAFAEQRRLMADLSHQLRTPITVIRGHLDLLRRGKSLSRRDTQESVKAAIEEADRMNRLVGNLLLLARTTSRNFFQPRPLTLRPFLQEIMAKAQVLAPRHWDLGDLPNCSLVADADQMTGALLNLLQNAVQHTQPDDSIGLEAAVNDGWVEIKVWDTGAGIPAEHLPAIFERFRRGPSADASNGHGTGLGLTIAQAVAQAHGGSIRAESQVGKGSVFTVRLPLNS